MSFIFLLFYKGTFSELGIFVTSKAKNYELPELLAVRLLLFRNNFLHFYVAFWNTNQDVKYSVDKMR